MNVQQSVHKWQFSKWQSLHLSSNDLGEKNICVTFRSQSFMCPSISPAPDSQGVRQGGSGAHWTCSGSVSQLSNLKLRKLWSYKGPQREPFYLPVQEKNMPLFWGRSYLFSVDTTRHVETLWKLASHRHYLVPVRHKNPRLLPSQGLRNGNLCGELHKPSGDSVRSLIVHQHSLVSD